MIFRPELSWEFLSADEILNKSVRAVRNLVRHVKEVSPHYQEVLFDVFPDDIKTADDIAALPLTSRNDVVRNTAKFSGVPPEEIVETVLTSGVTGVPLVFPMTANDIDRLAFNEALSFHSAGIVPADRAQILVSLERLCFAGMANFLGMKLLGANTARIGVLPLDMQRNYIDLLKPTVLVGTPSHLKKLVIDMKQHAWDPAQSAIRKLICVSESIRAQDMQLNGVGRFLEKEYNALTYSSYSATELASAFCECEARNGGHAHPELIYTEIVGDAGKPVPDGTPGELVVTPLGIEGMPLVRYRTGDITFKISTPCSCGRASFRIGPILARTSQIIKVKGAVVYPLTITNALDELHVLDDYVVVLEGDALHSDSVTIHAVTAPANILTITTHLRNQANVQFPILITNSRTLEALRGDSRKKTRIIDKRMHAR